MANHKRKFPALAAVSAFFLLAGAISCKGFFVDPTLTGLAVTCPNASTCGSSTSAPNLAASGTARLVATGNYDDGSSKVLTGSANWSSSDASQITVNNTNDKGTITALVASTASPVTITATDGTVNGSVSVTVGQTPVTVTCTVGCNGTSASLTTQQITLTASTPCNWSSGNTQVLTISGSGNTVTATLLATGTATVTATPTGSGFASGSITITVTN